MNDYTYPAAAYNQPNPLFSGVWLFVWFAFLILALVSYWKIFEKAGQAGWKIFIPIYNLYILLKIINKPGWWLILYFIPFVNLIISIVVALKLAHAFNRSSMFGFFLLFLFQPIGILILGFGKSTYANLPASPTTAAKTSS